MAFDQPACHTCESTLVSRLFCFSCNALQPFPREIDFFEVLGFPVSFELKSTELEERYQELSLELHPDFYGSAPEAEKLLSETAAAILNTAFKTLCEPTLRASYLLHLQAAKQKLDERSLPEGFLAGFFCRKNWMNCWIPETQLNCPNCVKICKTGKQILKQTMRRCSKNMKSNRKIPEYSSNCKPT